ncbi:MAG: aspartate/glutamate racemase family protein [Bdellovibrionales bacterium]|nr:aspartate/glutamate racemase family protein [Bdellovibrionales bacterium]
MRHSKIGIFSPGMGALAALHACQLHAPGHTYHFFSDSFHSPFGNRPIAEIEEYVKEGILFLAEHRCTTILIACNTSSLTLPSIQENLPSNIRNNLPIFDIISCTLNTLQDLDLSDGIVVFGTQQTIQNGKYNKSNINSPKISSVFSSKLANLIDKEASEDEILYEIYDSLKQVLNTETKPANLLLACTHYSLVYNQILQICSELGVGDINIVDQANIFFDWLPKFEATNSGRLFFSTNGINQIELTRRIERVCGRSVEIV